MKREKRRQGTLGSHFHLAKEPGCQPRRREAVGADPPPCRPRGLVPAPRPRRLVSDGCCQQPCPVPVKTMTSLGPRQAPSPLAWCGFPDFLPNCLLGVRSGTGTFEMNSTRETFPLYLRGLTLRSVSRKWRGLQAFCSLRVGLGNLALRTSLFPLRCLTYCRQVVRDVASAFWCRGSASWPLPRA